MPLVEECQADVNYQDQKGLAPLAYAACQGHVQIVECLLGNGAKTQTGGPQWAQPAVLNPGQRAYGNRGPSAPLRYLTPGSGLP